MKTVQTTNILAVRACFATETLCIGTILDRQLGFVQNNVTVNIRHRYLGSRNQVEIVYLAVVHLTFLVRQLACTVA